MSLATANTSENCATGYRFVVATIHVLYELTQTTGRAASALCASKRGGSEGNVRTLADEGRVKVSERKRTNPNEGFVPLGSRNS
jgi:hypothetical protein